MNTQSKYSGLRGPAIVLMLIALLLGGLGLTGAAAQSAVPGDTLYSVKSTIEQTRLSLARDAGERAQLRLGFAQQRLQELQTLIADGRYRQVSETVLAFESDVHGAILELETVSRLDPQRASQIALEITSALSRFAQILGGMQAGVPESVSQEMQRALDTTEIAGSLDLSQVGLEGEDDSNGNANINEDDNANLNENENANTNDDDNANTNEGENANINEGENANTNGSGTCISEGTNTNGEDGCSQNGNTNGNINGEDSNTNTGNDNSSTGSGNTNTDDSGGSGSGSGGGGGSGSGGSGGGGESGSGGGGGSGSSGGGG